MFIKAPLTPYSTLIVESGCPVQKCMVGTIEGVYRRLYMEGYIGRLEGSFYI